MKTSYLQIRACIVIFFLVTGKFLMAQPLFQSVAGLSQTDEATCAFQAKDSSYTITGYLSSPLDIPWFSCLILDKKGNVSSAAAIQSMGFPNLYHAKKIIPVRDKNYVILGGAMNGAGTNLDMVLMKVNPSLSKIWLKQLIGPNDEFGMDIIEDVEDEGLVIAGTDSVPGRREAIVIKTDKNGVFKWGQVIPLQGIYSTASAVTQADNRDIVVTGFYYRPLLPAGIAVTIFVCVLDNKTGHIKNLYYLSRGNVPGIDLASAIISTPDKGFLLAGGQTKGSISSIEDVLVIKLKSDLSVEWARSYSSNLAMTDMAYSVVKASDNNFVIGGTTYDNNGNGSADGFLMKINSTTGNVLWANCYGTSNNEHFNVVIESLDKGFLAAGKSNAAGITSGSSDMYFVKTNNTGGSACNTKASSIHLGSAENIISTVLPRKDSAYPCIASTLSQTPIHVTVSDSIVCAPLQVYAGNDTTLCPGTSLTIWSSEVSGGKTPYLYTWTNPDGFMPPAESNKLHPTTSPITKSTFFIFSVRDGTGETKRDTMRVTIKPHSAFTGLKDDYCTSSPMSPLTADSGVVIIGPGIHFNGSFWYFNPEDAGPGTHIITSIGCDTTKDTAIVHPAPCISDLISDTTNGSVTIPQGIFTDCDGTIYLTNKTNIARIDTFGVVTRIAGHPTESGYKDGWADSAKMNIPCGIIKTHEGVIYFTDNLNYSVRMLKNDSVYTIAGSYPVAVSAYTDGPGNVARFIAPYGLTYDQTRNCLYVSESSPVPANNRIRKIDLTPGKNYMVTTLLGGGATTVSTTPIPGTQAKLNQPKHIATDGQYLYITDQHPSARVIYRYNLTDSTIVLYAGQMGLSGTTDGPRLSAKFVMPTGVATSCSGDLFITDQASMLRIIHRDIVSTYPDPYSLINTPQGISTFVKGFVDVANTGDNNVLRLTIKDWKVGPWIGLDTADFTYCVGESPDTLTPLYDCGSYAGPGISLAGGKYIFTPPGVPGDYFISYTYQVGYCTETVYHRIRVVANPSLSMPDSAAICSGQSALLDAGPGYIKYVWSTSQTTRTILAGTTGNYWVEVTDSNGCKDRDTTFVLARPRPTVDAGPNKNICVGDTIKVGGTPTASGNGPFSYAWTPNGDISDTTLANPAVWPATTRRYRVWVTDRFGCMEKDSVTVTVNPLPVPNVGVPMYRTCAGQPVQIGGPATGGVSYSWKPAAYLNNPSISNPVATVTSNTFFVLTVTYTATGCSASDSTLVFVYSNPIIDAGPDDSICSGSSTTLQGSILVASGVPSIAWTPPTGLSDPGILTPTASPPSTQLYKLTVTDNQGCKASDSVWIYVSNVVVNAGQDTYICRGVGKQIGGNPTATGGLGNYTYQWSPATSLSATTIANPIATPAVLTQYKVQAWDVLGCTGKDSVVVDVYDNPVANAGADTTVCKGDVLVLGGTPVASGGHPSYQYAWSPPAGIDNPSADHPQATVNAPSTYQVIVTDAAGCRDTSSVTVNIYPLPVVQAGTDDTLCYGYSKQIGGNPTGGGTVAPYAFLWTHGNTLDDSTAANPTAHPTASTRYTVRVTDGRGCRDTGSMILYVLPKRGINISDTSVCRGEPVQLVAQGGTSYLWSPSTGLNNPAISNPIAMPDSQTTYIVTITSRFCPPDSATVTIHILPAPVITAWPDTTIFRGDIIHLYVTGGLTYQWQPANNIVGSDTAADIMVNPIEETIFTVTGKNSYGCSNRDSVIVRINPLKNVFVPSAFTPNGDGVNDVLKVETVGIARIHFYLYNRWGQLVFETTDRDQGWDGTFNGVLQHTQTFGYVLETEDFDGNKKVYKGTTTLIR